MKYTSPSHTHTVHSVCLTIVALSAFSTFADVSVVGGERFTYDGTDPSIDGRVWARPRASIGRL